MNSFLLVFIIASILAVIIYLYLWHPGPKKRRAKKLASIAEHLGFAFTGDIDIKPKEKFAPL